MQLPSGRTAPLNSRQPAQEDGFADGMNNLQCLHDRSGKEACASYPKLSRAIRSDSDRPERLSQLGAVSDLFSDGGVPEPLQLLIEVSRDADTLTGTNKRNKNFLLCMI